MWAHVFHRRRLAGLRPVEDDRLAEDPPRQKLVSQFIRSSRHVPVVSKEHLLLLVS